MKKFDNQPALCKYRQLGALLTLLMFLFTVDLQAQCDGIAFSFEHYEPCHFRARYANTTDCFTEIRYILESGTFSSWDVNDQAGFTVDVVSPSELWIHHNQGFLPLGNQTPLLFTLPHDLITTMHVAYNNNCAQIGCEIIGGIPIESCPDPQDASITGVKYLECNNLPYLNQAVIPGWTIQLLDADSNILAEQVTDASGEYAFYNLPMGNYYIKELSQPGWQPNVPPSGQYSVALDASQQAVLNFGNCHGPQDASITGVKYLECNNLPYSNQEVIPGWTIQLLDADSNIITEQVTDSSGEYVFYNLPMGNYYIKELSQPGWQPNVPPSGQYSVALDASQQAVLNFGNCPSCSCDSIYLEIDQLEGTSDTATYFLNISNSGAYCFKSVNIQVDTGQLLDWEILLAGWTVTQTGPNSLQVSSPDPYLPSGGKIPLSFEIYGLGNHTISATTSWGNGTECKKVWPFPSPPPTLPKSCCPNNSTPGPELVMDGDFTNAIPGALSGFNWSTAYYTNTVVNSPGKLDVTNGVLISNHNPYFASMSKTGSPTDKFLIVDASTVASDYVWEQSVTVTKNTYYTFCAYFKNIIRPGTNIANPVVVMEILDNTASVIEASSPQVTLVEGQPWVKLAINWTPIQTGTYRLRIRPISLVQSGNDFGVDCISFRKCSFQPTLECSCPTGFSLSPNLVLNGDFTQGPTGFSTQLSGPTSCGQGNYNVLSSLSNFCPFIWPNTPAHSAPWMLCIDGSPNTAQVLWQSQVTTLAANSDYCFSFYWTPVNNSVGQNIPISIEIRDKSGNLVNTVTANPTFDNLSGNPLTWYLKSYVFSTGTSLGAGGPWTISISQTSGAPQRGWGIDDICLTKLPPLEPCSPDFSVQFINNCGLVQFNNTSMGTNLSYSWNFGDNSQTSTQQNPVHQYMNCGTYTVCLSISGPNCLPQTACQQITISDVTPPIITCPQNITVQGILDPLGKCFSEVTGIAPTASDDCTLLGVAYIINNGSLVLSPDASGTIFNQGTTTVTYYTADWCANTSSCSFTVTIECHDCACVTPPNTPGPDLVVDGDFTFGGGFSSGYTNNCSNLLEGQYCITNTPQNVHTGFSACADVSTGNILVVNGATTPGVNVWCETFTVNPGTDYIFSYYVTSLTSANPAQLQVYIGNIGSPVPVGSVGQAPTATCFFRRACVLWNSGSHNGPIQVCIKDINLASQGNDFALDMIKFQLCDTVCTADFSIQQVNCSKFNFIGFGNGVPPYTYCWDFDNNPATCESTLQNPMWQFPTCGTYNICLTIYDAVGCSATYCQPITVADNIPPVALCNPGIGVALDANCMYQVTPAFVDGGSTDNCQIKSMSVSPSIITGCGNTIVTLTVTDWCNNTSTCTMGIQTIEAIPPMITCPKNVYALGTIDSQGQCKAIVNGLLPSASDNCSAPAVTYQISAPTGGSGNGDASGTNFMQGTSTVTYTATDGCNNTSSCSFNVEVACGTWPCDCQQGLAGQELILNGSFQAGSTGFSSDYNPLTGLCAPKESTVTDPVQVTTLCNNWAATDHTTGNSTAGWLFYAVDGSQIPGDNAWKQQLTLTGGVTYSLCGWAKNLNEGIDLSDPIVEAYVLDASMNTIGGPIATTGPLSESSGWVGFTGSFTTSTSGTGTYFLAIRTASTAHDGNDFALDDISFRACTPQSCTCSPNAFSNMSYRPNSGPNVPVSCDQVVTWGCSLPTFNLSGNFMCQGNCPNPIPMFWTLNHPVLGQVDQGIMSGPAFSVSVPNTSFPSSGLYTLTLAGICGMDTCYCKITIETPGCDTGCTCGQVTGVMFYSTWDWVGYPSCNANDTLDVPCLKPGQSYFVHGDFTCSSPNCSVGQVAWTLNRPSPLNPVTGTANNFYPHFDILLSGAYFTQPGIYQLTLTRICGTTPCTCTITFKILPCPCTCVTLPHQTLSGFNVRGSIFSCTRRFKPAGHLCSNDHVNWYVNGSLVGTTTDNNPFIYMFPKGGTYRVCMVVTRIDQVTGQECSYSYCRWVKVRCLTGPSPNVCIDNSVKNGNFEEGAVPGDLRGDGELQNWEWLPTPGTGSVFVDTADGGNDDGSLIFSGGKDNFGAVYQKIDFATSNFINIEYFYQNLQGEDLPDGTVLEFRLNLDSTVGSDNLVIYTQAISKDTSEAGWQERFVSLNANSINPDYRYLVVCVRNDDPQRQSLIALDNLVICGSDAMLTATGEALNIKSLRIFPNPNSGTFTIEMPEPAKPGTLFRITDPAGRLMQEQKSELGSARQTLQAGALPDGLYFIQVVTDGKVLAMEKFVKQ